MNFTTVQSVTIPEGVVIQITDASGRVIWAANGGKTILEVKKITDDTYVNDTVWKGDNFILLDIYPKSANSVVKVTYGGLTKTLRFIGTNAQQVYFGTYGGVSDSIATPESGELTIEGAFIAYGCGAYKADAGQKYENAYCPCITDIIKWGSMTNVCNYAFSDCTDLTSVTIPNIVKSIGSYAFEDCTSLASVEIGDSVTSIGDYAFYGCSSLVMDSLPSGITSIGNSAFSGCKNVWITRIPDGVTNIGGAAFYTEVRAGNVVYQDTLILPSSLVEIGGGAFAQKVKYEGNDSMDCRTKNVVIYATTPPIMSGQAFGEVATYAVEYSITVPKGCGDAYKSAEGWSNYASRIVEAE